MKAFQIGDYVEIKSWKEMAEEFDLDPVTGNIRINGHMCFNRSMEKYCSHRAFIQRRQESALVNYTVVTLANTPTGTLFDTGNWIITEDMIKHVPSTDWHEIPKDPNTQLLILSIPEGWLVKIVYTLQADEFPAVQLATVTHFVPDPEHKWTPEGGK